jgi:alpha-glucosidase
MAKWHWWQSTVIYQIYPRSFSDSNGDGVGDLQGIINRIDYLAQLGVGALWRSPSFTSPMSEFGYDIADYRGIDPLFGDMKEFDHFVADAHRAGLKVILDLVPNHSSDDPTGRSSTKMLAKVASRLCKERCRSRRRLPAAERSIAD